MDFFDIEVFSMQRAKRLYLFLAVVIFAFFAVPFPLACADSPPPPNYFYSDVKNAGPNVKYADILIKMDTKDKNYAKLYQYNLAAFYFEKTAPIVAYNKDGYVSISFHCRSGGTESSSILDNRDLENIVELNNGYKPISSMTKMIKIALLDQKGNILKVSDAVSVVPTDNDTYPHSVDYDARGTKPQVRFEHYYRSPVVKCAAASLPFLIAFFLRMVISTALETVIAIPFKIKPLWKIILVNIITQTMLFTFVTTGILRYAGAVAVGEAAAFVIEFWAYVVLYRQISKSKLAFYTIIANSSSLAVGLVLNVLHILTV